MFYYFILIVQKLNFPPGWIFQCPFRQGEEEVSLRSYNLHIENWIKETFGLKEFEILNAFNLSYKMSPLRLCRIAKAQNQEKWRIHSDTFMQLRAQRTCARTFIFLKKYERKKFDNFWL